MKITIGFELESGVDDAQMTTWLNGILAGEEPVKTRKARKPRKPMTDAGKKAFRKRMVDGQAKAAKNAAKEAKSKTPAKSKS